MTAMFVLSLLVTGCGEKEEPTTPSGPAEPGSRGRGQECVTPQDCQEGLWCMDGRCRQPLDKGTQRKQEMERIQDEHYEQLNDKIRSIEEQLRQ